MLQEFEKAKEDLDIYIKEVRDNILYKKNINPHKNNTLNFIEWYKEFVESLEGVHNKVNFTKDNLYITIFSLKYNCSVSITYEYYENMNHNNRLTFSFSGLGYNYIFALKKRLNRSKSSIDTVKNFILKNYEITDYSLDDVKIIYKNYLRRVGALDAESIKDINSLVIKHTSSSFHSIKYLIKRVKKEEI